MNDQISQFTKSRPFLVCIDSDGCAMDTMEVKHRKCFAPMAIVEWQLQDIEGHFMEVWNDINLYSKTRGINRFKGLVKTFETLAEEGYDVPDLFIVGEWIRTTAELSAPSLMRAIEATDHEQLKKTLAWSNAVNLSISKLSDQDRPFDNVHESLKKIHQFADIAIVSSANGKAVHDEWTRHSLSSYVNVMCGQEAGSKAYCISQLMAFGYDQDQVLMVGDAPGDLDAAIQNHVAYYPILVGREDDSWHQLSETALEKFLSGTYKDVYQQEQIDAFNDNLK